MWRHPDGPSEARSGLGGGCEHGWLTWSNEPRRRLALREGNSQGGAGVLLRTEVLGIF